ncbi:MAG: CinA family protein [Rickettsiales bacterium]
MRLPDNKLITNVTNLLENYRNRKLKLATAESCTGGMISSLITEISGSSDVFECGFVTYSNESKINLLGVDGEIIEKYGAVSEQTAIAMALGAINRTRADIAVSVTGIAGPSGGSKEKPVGLVYIATAKKDGTNCIKNIFTGSRHEIRLKTVIKSIEIMSVI